MTDSLRLSNPVDSQASRQQYEAPLAPSVAGGLEKPALTETSLTPGLELSLPNVSGRTTTVASPASILSHVKSRNNPHGVTAGQIGALSRQEAIDLIAGGGFEGHNPLTLGTASGLSLAGQVLSLALATTGTPGAMSAQDKTALNGLGTMAAQNASAIAVTGGTLAGLTSVTATTFIGNGSQLTTLNASALSSGTVAAARLGSGTANSTTFLRGDGAWAVVDGLPSELVWTGSALTIEGDLLPTGTGCDIGSPSAKFRAIYAQELHLDANTLYIGETAVLGTSAETVEIKADPDQSITVKTLGTGQSKIISENGVELSASGLNADVTVQATGAGGRVVFGATTSTNFTAPTSYFTGAVEVSGNATLGSLTVSGNLTVNGATATVNATTVQIADNILLLNKGEVGVGVTAGTAGLRVDRGEALDGDYYFVFDESDDLFKVGKTSNLGVVATRGYVDDSFADAAPAIHEHDIDEVSGLTAALSGKAAASALTAHTDNAAIHRSINDEGASTTDLWSASKIASEIAAGGGEADHAELTNLDYDSSGHTGFASSEDLSSLFDTVAEKADATALESYLPLTGGAIAGTLSVKPHGLYAGTVSVETYNTIGAGPALAITDYSGVSKYRALVNNGGGFQFISPNGTTILSATNAGLMFSRVLVNERGWVYQPSVALDTTSAHEIGFYVPGGLGSDTLGVITARTERMRFTATGEVLVGTVTNNGVDRLQVDGSVSATSFKGNGSAITNLALTAIGEGTRDETTFLRGDGTWSEVEASGGEIGDQISVEKIEVTSSGFIEAHVGTVIGTSGSYNNNPAFTRDAVFDGDLSTYFDSPNANGSWVGMDFGEVKSVDRIRFCPRSGWASRLNGGKFQGSSSADFTSDVVDLYTISGNPAQGVMTSVDVEGSFRYVRYLSPDNSYGNIAEVQFQGSSGGSGGLHLITPSGTPYLVFVDDQGWLSARDINALSEPSDYKLDVPGVVNATGYAGIIETIGITVDGADAALTTGSKGFRRLDHDYVIEGWVIVVEGDAGDVTFGVKMCDYTDYPTATSIVGSGYEPKVVAGIKAQSSTLTGWTTSLFEGDFIEFTVEAATTVVKASLYLRLRRV